MKIIQRLIAGLIILLLAACNLPSVIQAPTETTMPDAPTLAPTDTTQLVITPTLAFTETPEIVITPTLAPTPTNLPLYQQVKLVPKVSEEAGKAPNYTFKTQVPVMEGSSNPKVDKFNQDISNIVQAAVDQFRKELLNQPAVPISAGSYFDLRYALISPPGPIFSLQIQIEGMYDGAAHPYHVTSAYNYDLETGQVITFERLFIPGSDPLTPISEYCKKELSKRDINFDMFAAGADPTAENYSVWNISADGLVIFFNEYQVAPYAAGPQTVVVPFSELENIIDPGGPLAEVKP